jgi:thiol-disulfide isomerase/thioredoxin
MSNFIKLLTVFAASLIVLSKSQASSIIQGKILQSNGEPLIDSGVMVLSPKDHNDKQFIKTNAQGDYSVTLNDKGLYYLKYKGVGVRNYHLNLLVNEDKKIELDMYLQPYRIKAVLNNLKADLYDVVSKKYIKSVELIKSKSGWFGTFTHKQGAVLYNINGLSQIGHAMANPSNLDSFVEVDQSGYVDVFSPIKNIDGETVIAVKKLVENNNKLAYFVMRNASPAQQLIAEESFNMLRDVLDLYEVKNNSPEEFELASKNYKLALKKKIDVSTGLKKQLLLIAGTMVLPNSADIAMQALKDVPVNSPIWSIRSELFVKALYKSFGEKTFTTSVQSNVDIANQIAIHHKELVNNFLKNNTSISSRKNLLRALLFDLADEDITGYFDQLYEIYFPLLDDKEKIRVEKTIGKSRKVAVGKELPEFQIEIANTPNSFISNESLKGKYVLIDFWASWCSPCLSEMPYLHEAYAEFKDKNFNIISISWDHSKENLDSFLNAKWTMPWTHAYDPENAESQLSKNLEVYVIPRTILIDPAGKIIAANSQLKGRQLIRTLSRLIDTI